MKSIYFILSEIEMRYSLGSRVVSSSGHRLQVVKYGSYFQYFPERRFFPSLKDWTQTLTKDSTLDYFSPHPVTPKQQKVLNLENCIAFEHRNSPMASKLKFLFYSLGIRSHVQFCAPKSFSFTRQKYTCGVWYDQEFFSFHSVLGLYTHFYAGPQVDILDLSSRWIHVAPCNDLVYIRGTLTNNLAKYALVQNKTFRLRVSWKSPLGSHSQEIDIDAF